MLLLLLPSSLLLLSLFMIHHLLFGTGFGVLRDSYDTVLGLFQGLPFLVR